MNNKQKGNRVEREAAKILNQRFSHLTDERGSFSRSVGSGNRWSQANLSAAAADTFAGDLVTPSGFLWCIEVKGGYSRLDLPNVLVRGSSRLESWIEQASRSAEAAAKKPLILWKVNNVGWIAAIPHQLKNQELNYLKYGNWFIYSFDDLLSQSDIVFIESKII